MTEEETKTFIELTKNLMFQKEGWESVITFLDNVEDLNGEVIDGNIIHRLVSAGHL